MSGSGSQTVATVPQVARAVTVRITVVHMCIYLSIMMSLFPYPSPHFECVSPVFLLSLKVCHALFAIASIVVVLCTCSRHLTEHAVGGVGGGCGRLRVFVCVL